MKKRLLSFAKYLFFLGLGIFLIWWSLHQIPSEKWGEFKKVLRTANYWLMAPVFVILTLSHVLRALRWKILMEPMGYRPRLVNTFFAVMIGYLANLAVPRLGEVLKCTLLARYEKVPAEKLVGTIVAERAVDVISLAFLFVFALLIQFDVVGEYGIQLIKQLSSTGSGSPSFVKIAVVLIVILALIVAIRITFKKFAHLRAVILVKKIVKGIWEGLSSVKNLQRKGLFIIYTVAIWALYALGTWVGLLATSGTSHLTVSDAVVVLAFGSIGMIITPGGIGAYAYFIAKVVEISGVPFEIGFANGTLQWFAQFIMVLAVGGLSLILLPLYNKKRIHESN